MRIAGIFALGGGGGDCGDRRYDKKDHYSYGGYYGGKFSYYNGYNSSTCCGGPFRNYYRSEGGGLLGLGILGGSSY